MGYGGSETSEQVKSHRNAFPLTNLLQNRGSQAREAFRLFLTTSHVRLETQNHVVNIAGKKKCGKDASVHLKGLFDDIFTINVHIFFAGLILAGGFMVHLSCAVRFRWLFENRQLVNISTLMS